MKTCAIVGINWGDEGKGRMVDLLTEQFDIVVRYQGGGNAGHTVINEHGKFALHLLPSGIFRKNVINILGNGVAMDPESLMNEIQVIGTPGEGFGACGEGFFRLSSFGNPEETKQAAERLQRLLTGK